MFRGSGGIRIPVSPAFLVIDTNWENAALPGGNETAPINVTFGATPSASNADAVVGFSTSPVASFASLSCLVRFNDTGTIDVYNGAISNYTSLTSVSYSAGQTFAFLVVINIPSSAYDVYVTPPGQSQIQIASGYTFRAAATVIGNCGGITTTGILTITNMAVALVPVQPPVVTSTSFSESTPISSGAVIGTVTATNFPTAWTILSGDPLGDFAISNSGVITAAQNISGTGSETLTVQASNTGGSGTGTVAISWAPSSGAFAPINPLTGQRWPDGGNTGYTNEPNFNTSTTALIAGVPTARSPGTLVPHPGNGGNIFPTPGTYRYVFFNTGGATVNINSSGTYTFIGCQFCQFDPNGNSNGSVSVTSGSTSFSYCSFTPQPTEVTTPVNGGGYTLWPSAGAQSALSAPGTSTYRQFMVPAQLEFALRVSGGGSMTGCTVDRCDFWGATNFIDLARITATSFFTITNSWVHDACSDSTGAHVDGIGMESDPGAQSNVTVQNCAVTSIGNTQGLAFQGGSVSYNDITIVGNYCTGFGATWEPSGNATVTNSQYTDNVFGTDIPTTRMTTPRSITGGQWRRNTIKIIPGTAPASTGMDNPWNNSQNGFFLYPNDTYNATDYTG